jgi:hypothetical protein
VDAGNCVTLMRVPPRAECLAGRRPAGLFAESARDPGDTGLVPIGTGQLALLEELLGGLFI